MTDQGLTLHSYRRCPFAIRVRMVLEEKNLPYTLIEEKLRDFTPALLRLHPEGKVPLLLHRDIVIYESAIITEYLDEAFPETPLMPKAAKERAEIRLWTYWCNNIFKPDLDAFKYKYDQLPEDQQNALINRLKTHLDKMAKPLSSHNYLLSDEFSLLDIHLFPFYRQLRKARKDFDNLFSVPLLDQWLERVTSRPSFERVMSVR